MEDLETAMDLIDTHVLGEDPIVMYLVFSGQDYHPAGGAKDLRFAAHTHARAMEMAIAAMKGNDWCHIAALRKSGTVEIVGDY